MKPKSNDLVPTRVPKDFHKFWKVESAKKGISMLDYQREFVMKQTKSMNPFESEAAEEKPKKKRWRFDV